MQTPDITVYHAPRTRPCRVVFLLEELGLPYKLVDVSTPESRAAAEYQNIHPLGKYPAITDGGTPIFESNAILQYITYRYGGGRLCPPVGSLEHGLFLQWLTFGENTITMPASTYNRHTYQYPPEKRIPEAAAAAAESFRAALDVVEKAIEGKDWILGSEFTTADITVSSGIRLGSALGLVVGDYPNAKAYLARYQARPAYLLAYPA